MLVSASSNKCLLSVSLLRQKLNEKKSAWISHSVLYLIGTVFRLSAARSVPIKIYPTILQAILKYWSSVYGASSNLISDNGGDFITPELIAHGAICGMIVQTTTAYCPLSDGIMDEHNKMLGDTNYELIADTGSNFDIPRRWTVSAKNSLNNISGCSPF